MEIETTRKIVTDFASVWNTRDLSQLDAVVGPDYVQHHAGAPQGLAGLKSYFTEQFEKMPDLSVVVEDTVCEADRAVARISLHKGWQADARRDHRSLAPRRRKARRALVGRSRHRQKLAATSNELRVGVSQGVRIPESGTTGRRVNTYTMGHDRPRCVTPDGRYLVVRGRLWRTTNPHLDQATRTLLVSELMAARRDVARARRAGDRIAEDAAHAAVDRAKHGLGERGPVWWSDGSLDYNRRLVHLTPYAEWFATKSKQA